MVGGTFKIESSPGKGTVVSAEIPVPRTAEATGSQVSAAIRVLLAEDHVVVREGLRILIEADGDIKIVAEAVTGREAVSMAKQLRPDVVVMDIAMPLLNGIQATQQILSESPKTKILILSAHADPEYVDQLMLLGVLGYLTKQTSAEMVAKAVRAIHSGRTFFSPSVAKHLRDHYQQRSSQPAKLPKEIRCA